MEAVVLFDGVCNLCNSSVNFIIDRDRHRYFHFAALQSDAGIELLRKHGRTPPPGDPDSIILVENGRVYERSTAALRIARKLRGAWKILYAGIIVPRPLRDVVYKWIARNRYRWFGKKDSCRMPTPELKDRFLQ
jgi:predicted DCC family thiol-disulfide oxidoreductase YuxK